MYEPVVIELDELVVLVVLLVCLRWKQALELIGDSDVAVMKLMEKSKDELLVMG